MTTQPHPDLTPELIAELEAKLEQERQAIITRTRARSSEALSERLQLPDEADQATAQEAQAFELKLANKDRKLLNLIEHAIDKMRRGEYGLCEGTDEPIELRRLQARPWARFSIAHKEQLELERSMHIK
ncbi:MAG: TraR/DksA family transcriptional regulator [Nannocystaceae bacterium]|nr:TraR/DksA family transcriptional regulator [bacterium]